MTNPAARDAVRNECRYELFSRGKTHYCYLPLEHEGEHEWFYTREQVKALTAKPNRDAVLVERKTFEQWWDSVHKFATDSDRLDHTILVFGAPFRARKEAAKAAWEAALQSLPELPAPQPPPPPRTLSAAVHWINNVYQPWYSRTNRAAENIPATAPDSPSVEESLRRGIDLVEGAFAHVSHGGPTRADAEKWLKEARNVLS